MSNAIRIQPYLICWLSFISFFTANGAVAQEKLEVTAASIGVADHFRLGCWTQVRLSVKSQQSFDNARLELTMPDGEGVPSTFVVDELNIASGESTLTATVKIGRVDSDLRVRLFAGEKLISERYFSGDELPDGVLASQYLVVALGSSLGMDEALKLRKEKEDQRAGYAEITDASSLPEKWLGYGGVNLIVMPTSANSVAAKMNDAQLAALEQWVSMGGRLIYCAGADSESTIVGDAVLERLLPGKFAEVRLQRESSNFEGYAGKTSMSLTAFPRDEDTFFRLPMTALSDVDGTVIFSEGLGAERTPAAVRTSYGLGHVIFLATDLELAPLAKWTDGRRQILGKLLDMSLGELPRGDQTAQFSSLTQIGFSDIVGQLRSAMDQFSGVSLIPFSWIAILIAAYVALIGPVDYFLLKRLNQRFSLTWVTFPLMVLGACALAFCLTLFWKSQTLAVNQINLIDIDALSGNLRGISWGHVSSPKNSKYDFYAKLSDEVFPNAQQDGMLASWQGLPGTGFGGMNNRLRAGEQNQYRVVQTKLHDSTSLEVSELPIDIHGTRSLSGFVWGNVNTPNESKLASNAENQIAGIVRNPLPVPLKNCQLYFGRWLYPLPSLAPGGEHEINPYATPKTIKFILTKSRVDKDTKDRSQPWDRKSFDTERIVQLMMFHESVGGTSYTSLLHRFQPEVDLTDHLTQNRAVLVGEVDKAALDLTEQELADDDFNVQSFVRIVLPVEIESRTNNVTSTASNK